MTTTNRHHILESSGPAGVTLRLSFVWWLDRFGHVISVVTPRQGLATVLNSLEGDAKDAWPASPPLQSLTLEQLEGGRRAALLIGMAGRSHWSASVETVPRKPALVFDVACRLGSLPAELGSRYTVASGVIKSGPGDKQREFFEVLTGGPVVRIYREAANGSAAKLRVPEKGEIVIRPDIREKAASHTIRWRYRVEVV
jgi:hypothetical protein